MSGARERLAEALFRADTGSHLGLSGMSYDATADALLPVVDRIAKERAAAEIRDIAHRLDDGGDEAIEVALGGAAYVHRVLCDTAHALDGKP